MEDDEETKPSEETSNPEITGENMEMTEVENVASEEISEEPAPETMEMVEEEVGNEMSEMNEMQLDEAMGSSSVHSVAQSISS